MEIACPICGRNLGDDRFVADGTLCASCAAEAVVPDPAPVADDPAPAPVEDAPVEVDPADVTPVEPTA